MEFVDKLSIIKMKLSGIKIKNNLVITDYMHRKLKFIHDNNEYVIRNVYEIFIKQIYKDLNVNGKEVIDIGASIGDSPIYFFINGANKVYAYEINKKRYNYMKRNIAQNNINNGIITINGKFREFNKIGNNSVLKMDCEGCEYEFFKENKFNQIRKFNQILMEYHNGKDKIVKDLETLGYIVSVKPVNKKVGMLYAKKIK
ncbi:MAG: FkbM family methyltransferase [Candidatus Micrarchaeaceae archaeon]